MNVDDLPLLIANPARIAIDNYVKNNKLTPGIKYRLGVEGALDVEFDKLDKHTGIGGLLLLTNEYGEKSDKGVSFEKLYELWKIVEELNYQSSIYQMPWALRDDMILRRLQHLLDISLAAELIADPNPPHSTFEMWFKSPSYYKVTRLGLALLKQNNLSEV